MGLLRDITVRQLAGHLVGPRLRTRAAAQYLGVGESTLEKWRCSGSGPQFERVGTRIVVYSVAALEIFLAARRANSTSELAPAREQNARAAGRPRSGEIRTAGRRARR